MACSFLGLIMDERERIYLMDRVRRMKARVLGIEDERENLKVIDKKSKKEKRLGLGFCVKEVD